MKLWYEESPTRTGAVAYCISAEGLIHLHMVLEDTNQARFTAIKKLYPKAHIEATKGNKQQAEDYINKRGQFQEKGEQVVYVAKYGEIKGAQGNRKELEIIQELIEKGFTPNQIMEHSFSFRKYEKMIKDGYFAKRKKETPISRKIEVEWIFGETGTGKTYTLVQLSELYGEDNIYIVSDYSSGFDHYNGEPIILLDEFRGQIPYGTVLMILQGYKQQIHARYTNAWTLWDKVFITSPLTPYEVYNNMETNDKKEQLYRRITKTTKCHIENGEYKRSSLLGARKRDDFISNPDGFIKIDKLNEDCPFI